MLPNSAEAGCFAGEEFLITIRLPASIDSLDVYLMSYIFARHYTQNKKRVPKSIRHALSVVLYIMVRLAPASDFHDGAMTGDIVLDAEEVPLAPGIKQSAGGFGVQIVQGHDADAAV